MDDLVNWLASLVPALHWHEQCECLLALLAYSCKHGDSPANFKEHDKTPVIRLWLAILREADISLHAHFRDMEESLDQREVQDRHHYRQGIKRVLEVEYGSDPDDVTILVRDVRVEIPPEECIPGAWHTDKTLSREGLVAKGLEPTANWRVSSKEDWSVSLRTWIDSLQSGDTVE